jgi:anti-sigma B factor antagonist
MGIGLFWFGRAISGNSHAVLDFSMRSEPAGDGLHVLSIEGEIDLFTAKEVKRAAADAMARGATRLVLDLSRTRFLDSSGLGVLIGIAKRLRPVGGDVAIVNTEPMTESIFTTTGVRGFVPIVDSRSAALRILRQRAAADLN